MKKRIILINSKARHGKDTLAAYIYKELEDMNKSCLISHNAKAVKDLAYNFYNWDGQKDKKGRKLLIDITDTGYNYDPYFWEKKNMINDFIRDVYIIPDWRYISSLDYFKGDNDIVTVHINRPNFENGLDEKLKNDKSEQGFEGFDFDFEVINNTLDDLRYASKKIVERILEK